LAGFRRQQARERGLTYGSVSAAKALGGIIIHSAESDTVHHAVNCYAYERAGDDCLATVLSYLPGYFDCARQTTPDACARWTRTMDNTGMSGMSFRLILQQIRNARR